MSKMSRPSRSSQPPPPSVSSSSRNNEYFVPRDGIDREVITADICRYLGQDALVRPGTYEDSDGRVIQGYYITAYRNLTTPMIQDLKADSARWEQERRGAAARNAAGVSSRPMGGSEYKDSTTHYNRQANGPSVAGNYTTARYDNQADAMMVDAAYPRYPGTGNSGYNGVSSSGYATQPGYAQGGFASTSQYPISQAQYAPVQTTDRYRGAFSGSLPASTGYGQSEFVQGAQYSTAYVPSASVMSGPPAGAPIRTGYAAGAGQAVYSQTDPYYQSPSGGSANYAQVTQPIDSFYGRGNQSATAQGYGSTPADANYNGSPAALASTPQPRIPSPPSGTQAQQISSATATHREERARDWDATSAGGGTRDRERERDRDRDRERDRARHREQEREDRHADRHHRSHRTRQ